jgi:hypothetical protein
MYKMKKMTMTACSANIFICFPDFVGVVFETLDKNWKIFTLLLQKTPDHTYFNIYKTKTWQISYTLKQKHEKRTNSGPVP